MKSRGRLLVLMISVPVLAFAVTNYLRRVIGLFTNYLGLFVGRFANLFTVGLLVGSPTIIGRILDAQGEATLVHHLRIARDVTEPNEAGQRLAEVGHVGSRERREGGVFGEAAAS